MNEEIVWLYKVYDVSKITAEDLQKELDKWSESIMPHETVGMNDRLLIIRYQSMFNRNGWIEQKAVEMHKQISNKSWNLELKF